LPAVKYVAGLDGLRAIAVISVLLFHAEFSFASGGFLGVSLFFTLSGFLITTLLITEHEATGTLSFGRFYGRRVRRLLPAAFAALALVVLLSGRWSSGQLSRLPGDVIAAVANVANWRFAFASTSYQDLFLGDSSPVAHFWSLAIEEQIYLVLPVVVYLTLRRGRRALAVTTGGLLAASIGATLLTTDRDLVYNGTHTRAAELLIGVALAQMLHRQVATPKFVPPFASPSASPSAQPFPPPVLPDRPGRFVTNTSWLPGSIALVVFVVLVAFASVQHGWVYRGGLVGVALVSSLLIAAVVHGRFPANLLAVAPLVAVGKVSYGIYLYHWPVFLVLDAERTGLDQIPLFVLRCMVTALLTMVSYRLIEQPIRLRRVIDRNRTMVPTMMVSAGALVAAAVLVVPSPSLTPTEELLALGQQEVVEFAATQDPPVRVPDPAGPASPASTTTPSLPPAPARPPARIEVLGSDPTTAAAIRAAARGDEFDVTEDIREDCPLSITGTPGCERLLDRWNARSAAGDIDTLVLVSNDSEADDALARKVVAVTDDDLIALGAADEAAIAEILTTIDAAVAAGVEVVWYTPAHPISAFYRHFSRVGVERPAAHTVLGGAATLVDALRDIETDRAARERGEAADDEPLRVLVIGDSTSLNFARALHDGSSEELAVLWAGANGCPFASVVATRGRSDAEWVEPNCTPWHVKVPPLVDSFGPDVLFVMTGPMELQEHRFADDPGEYVAGEPTFAAQRDAELDRLLAVLPSGLPMLVADLPAIAEGRFSGPEMASPERLAVVNAHIAEWDQRHTQVVRFPYRDTLDAAEAARPPGDQIRSDGTHPDVEPLAELARDVYIAEMIRLTAEVRAQLDPALAVDD
jgi:peptidoglycan/LPS O-acetylase OafA/YrhL